MYDGCYKGERCGQLKYIQHFLFLGGEGPSFQRILIFRQHLYHETLFVKLDFKI